MVEGYFPLDDHEFESESAENSFWNLYEDWQELYPDDDMGPDSDFWDIEYDFRDWDELDYQDRRDLLYDMGYIDEETRDDEDYKPD